MIKSNMNYKLFVQLGKFKASKEHTGAVRAARGHFKAIRTIMCQYDNDVFHASGKSCGQNGPKFIAPSIFGQILNVMSGFFSYRM